MQLGEILRVDSKIVYGEPVKQEKEDLGEKNTVTTKIARSTQEICSKQKTAENLIFLAISHQLVRAVDAAFKIRRQSQPWNFELNSCVSWPSTAWRSLDNEKVVLWEKYFWVEIFVTSCFPFFIAGAWWPVHGPSCTVQPANVPWYLRDLWSFHGDAESKDVL